MIFVVDETNRFIYSAHYSVFLKPTRALSETRNIARLFYTYCEIQLSTKVFGVWLKARYAARRSVFVTVKSWQRLVNCRVRSVPDDLSLPAAGS